MSLLADPRPEPRPRYDLQLLDWLNKYTFPSEAKFKDAAFAARVCRNAVARTLRNGTTSCMYCATIHTDAALQLGRLPRHAWLGYDRPLQGGAGSG